MPAAGLVRSFQDERHAPRLHRVCRQWLAGSWLRPLRTGASDAELLGSALEELSVYDRAPRRRAKLMRKLLDRMGMTALMVVGAHLHTILNDPRVVNPIRVLVTRLERPDLEHPLQVAATTPAQIAQHWRSQMPDDWTETAKDRMDRQDAHARAVPVAAPPLQALSKAESELAFEVLARFRNGESREHIRAALEIESAAEVGRLLTWALRRSTES
jgi:hypothetical protein